MSGCLDFILGMVGNQWQEKSMASFAYIAFKNESEVEMTEGKKISMSPYVAQC